MRCVLLFSSLDLPLDSPLSLPLQKAEAASEFAQTEILPELKKIYEAATAETTTNKNKRR